MAEAADIAREAALAAPTAGRALAAANAALDWPEPPHLVLWHAQTVLREHRGDGHVAALLTAGLDPVEALVVVRRRHRDGRGLAAHPPGLAGAASGRPAADRLADRGLLDRRRTLTAAGRAVRAEVEARTDALADAAVGGGGRRARDRLIELVAPLVAAIVAGDGFLRDNPMGLRRCRR